jgi:ABC-type Zn uptake system ZnuABC Zn-binding protein ZnuA
MKRVLALLVWLLTAFALSQSERKTVIVSFLPYLTPTERIAAGRLEVRTLLPAGASPHAFDPTPKDLLAVRDAELLILSGYGVDSWLERLHRASDSKAVLVKVAERLEFERIRTGEFVDAHVWLDVSIMAKAAFEIGESLARFDPQQAAFYRRNATRERERLLALHEELKRNLAPIRGAKLVVLHDAWSYFARAYGLEVLGVIRVQADREPSAKEMADVTKLIREHRIKAIFFEPQLPDRAAKAIARETGVRIGMLDPEGTTENRDYTALMRFNQNVMLEFLRP